MTTARCAVLVGLALLAAPGAAIAKPPVCPAGQLVSDDTANHCCWPRQVWSKSRQTCVGIPTCPEGFEAAKETCQPMVCTQGQVSSEDTRGHCCWRGQAWSKGREACVGVPVCPAGWVARGETCMPDASWESELAGQPKQAAEAPPVEPPPVVPLVEAPVPAPPPTPAPAVAESPAGPPPPQPPVVAPGAPTPVSRDAPPPPPPGSGWSKVEHPPEAAPAPIAAAAVEPAQVESPEDAAMHKTRAGIGFRAFYFPEDNKWGPAPELAIFRTNGGFKGGAFFAVLPGGSLGIEAGARISGGPTIAKRVTLDFGADLGLIFVPARTELYIDLAVNVVAASVRVGPILISLRAISPVLYLGITKTDLLMRIGAQSGFTVAF